MATYKKVGTFTRVTGLRRGGGAAIKLGGNVATYVCTPDGRVIHAIPGNVGGQVLAKELAWARDLYAYACLATGGNARAVTPILRAAHRARAAAARATFEALVKHTAWNQQPRHLQLEQPTTRAQPTAKRIRTLTRLLAETRRPPLPARLGLLVVQNQGLSAVFPYLAKRAGDDLKQVYAHVWTRIVGEAVSDAPVRTVSGFRGCRVRAPITRR